MLHLGPALSRLRDRVWLADLLPGVIHAGGGAPARRRVVLCRLRRRRTHRIPAELEIVETGKILTRLGIRVNRNHL